jgi:hypothetical protein
MAPALADRNVAAILLGRRLPGASRNQPGQQAETAPKVSLHAIPIRFCSRWGLPCRLCRQTRGGLLPHPFTLTPPAYRFGTPALRRSSRYEGGAVCFLWHFPWGRPRRQLTGIVFLGARTFLTRGLSALARAAARPTGRPYKGSRPRNCKRKRGDARKRRPLLPEIRCFYAVFQAPARCCFTFEQYADETGFIRVAAWPAL